MRHHLPLLSYTEAISLLYSLPIFSFDSLETFLAFSYAILPRRFDSIRRLQLDFQFSTAAQFSESHPDNNMPWWERIWRVIATIRDLEEIRRRQSHVYLPMTFAWGR